MFILKKISKVMIFFTIQKCDILRIFSLSIVIPDSIHIMIPPIVAI